MHTHANRGKACQDESCAYTVAAVRANDAFWLIDWMPAGHVVWLLYLKRWTPARSLSMMQSQQRNFSPSHTQLKQSNIRGQLATRERARAHEHTQTEKQKLHVYRVFETSPRHMARIGGRGPRKASQALECGGLASMNACFSRCWGRRERLRPHQRLQACGSAWPCWGPSP